MVKLKPDAAEAAAVAASSPDEFVASDCVSESGMKK